MKTSVTKMPDHSVTWCELLGFGLLVDDMDVCPWPSRQVPVRPYAEDCAAQEAEKQEGRYCPDTKRNCQYLTPSANELNNMLDEAKAAGRLAGLQEAMEAVANIRLRFDSDTPGNVDLTLPEFQWVRDKAIAAIDAVKGEW